MNFSGSEGLLAASWDIRSPIVSFTLFFSENTVQERSYKSVNHSHLGVTLKWRTANLVFSPSINWYSACWPHIPTGLYISISYRWMMSIDNKLFSTFVQVSLHMDSPRNILSGSDFDSSATIFFDLSDIVFTDHFRVFRCSKCLSSPQEVFIVNIKGNTNLISILYWETIKMKLPRDSQAHGSSCLKNYM